MSGRESGTPGSEYTTPLYSQTEVAQIVVAPRSTVSTWASGYRTSAGSVQAPVLSHVAPGRGITVPFLALAEAYVLTAFRKAGLPLQRIRPAVDAIKEQIGLEYALASDLLLTDGVEVLARSDDPADQRLVVVRNGDAIFTEAVRDYLRFIDFGQLGIVSSIRLPRFEGMDVRVTPTINAGQPTVFSRGVAVASVLGRLRAGDDASEIAADYSLPVAEVLYLNRTAA